MAPEAIKSLFTLALGFGFAGLLASIYQLLTARPPSFALLRASAQGSPFVTIPLLMFTAPFIIMRNTLRAAHVEEGGFGFAMLATMVAGFWSLLSGTLVTRMIVVVNYFMT